MDILAFINLVAGLRGDLSHPTRKRMMPKIAALALLATLIVCVHVLDDVDAYGHVAWFAAIAAPLAAFAFASVVGALFYWIGRGLRSALHLLRGAT